MVKNKKKKVLKYLLVFICIVTVILVAAALFLRLWPAFGARASQKKIGEYAKRASNFHDGIFYNEEDFSVMRDVEEGVENDPLSYKGNVPAEEIPVGKPAWGEHPSAEDLTVTWFGHSSLLVQMEKMNILIDPVFSERSSPVSFVGSKRFSNPPVTLDDLPEIDILIVSHDHYDHLDYNVIKQMKDRVKHFIVPLGVENHLERWGVPAASIHEMAWWEEVEIDGLTIGCTPARHYSGRSLDDRFATLWASWVLKGSEYQIFESGDTGFGNHFEKIQERYGDFDLVLLDCAQYDVRWPDVHMNPEESYQASRTLGAKWLIPIHWGAFRLADHPWDDPAERMLEASGENADHLVTPKIGETVDITNLTEWTQRWWQEVE